eukprot:CAMPEP_0198600156 /NCGR_PEP_ID=MMETSP1462-20131121/147873_1 /TAXON_ID=1333877 /ORGANISM="Brandtodinium nutriculum, Strain RCC3387" /LENGTH=50 /DNA_ID=CAMNT_0044331861 /DNA_START=18 /DNA_END=167 /DNA_ORIENTATION=+
MASHRGDLEGEGAGHHVLREMRGGLADFVRDLSADQNGARVRPLRLQRIL